MNDSNKYQSSLNDIITKLESIKRIDKNNIEFWYAHDLYKVLKYSKFSTLKPVIKKAELAIMQRGLNVEDHIKKCKESFINGIGAVVPVNGYKVSKLGLYYIIINCYYIKPDIATLHGYYADNTVTMEAMRNALNNINHID